MAAGIREWSVLPHGPIEKVAENLWRVEGRMSESNRRVMILVRLSDGRIVIHNAIALDDAAMKEIDEWGEVSTILVPNGLHRRDAFVMQQRYPKAKVYAPSGAVAAASKATPCTGTYADVAVDASLSMRDLEGVGHREGVMLVRSDDGVSAVFCDTLLNIPKQNFLLEMFLNPTGVLAVPRMTRVWFAKNLAELRADLERLSQHDGLVRIIPGHGAIVATDAAARLAEAAARL